MVFEHEHATIQIYLSNPYEMLFTSTSCHGCYKLIIYSLLICLSSKGPPYLNSHQLV